MVAASVVVIDREFAEVLPSSKSVIYALRVLGVAVDILARDATVVLRRHLRGARLRKRSVEGSAGIGKLDAVLSLVR